MKLPKQPERHELQALARLAESQEGNLILSWIERNAIAFLEASMSTDSDARSRQAQGGWSALTSFINTARTAKDAARTEHS